MTSFISCTQLQAQQFYKWVDQKGSTHYTTTPPPKNAQRQGTLDTYSHSVARPDTTATASTSNNLAVPTDNVMDQQQQEANAALKQGRQR